MKSITPCLLYYSHSWLPQDVDINLAIWDAIWAHCRLVVDSNEEADPPYYISRIEDLIRRCDAFLAVLLPKLTIESETQSVPSLKEIENDYGGSPYMLFEVRLAERANKPRLVLYDAQTRFNPGMRESQGVRYLEFNRKDVYDRGNEIWVAIAEWLETVGQRSGAVESVVDGKAAILLSEELNRAPENEAVRSALMAAGVTEIVDLMASLTDVDTLTALRNARLLVAEVTSSSLWDAYGVAHALFIPTIRLFRGSSVAGTNSLPRITWGHRVGYQDDLVRWSDPTELKDAVAARVLAILNTPAPISDRDAGQAFFERRR